MKPHPRAVTLGLVAILTLLLIFWGAAAQAQEGGLTETFDNPNLPGWERSPNAEVVDGSLLIDLDGIASHAGTWGDLQLSLRSSLAGKGALVIRYRTSEAGEYALYIAMDEVTLHRAGEPIAHEAIDPLPPGESFQLEIFSLEGHQEILLYGQAVLVTVDPEPLPPGGVALAVEGDALGIFDDLSVLPLDGAPPGEAPPAQEPEATEPAATEAPAVPEPISEPAAMGDLAWVRTGGPPGGVGYDIRYKYDDSTIWFVTDNFAGVHISNDNGLTWEMSDVGIPGQLGPSGDWRPIFSLTVDPHNPDTIWAGTDKTGHIYKSVDGGLTWTRKDQGVQQRTDVYDALSFRGFTIDPNDPNVIYAMGEIADIGNGGAAVWGLAIGGVVYKTVDGGENWALLWDGGIPSSLTRYMWINPQDTDVLYVSTGIFDRGAVNELDPLVSAYPYGGLGILKSTDGGETWRVLNEANGLNFLYVSSLFMHPQEPDTLLAATGKGESELYLQTEGENNPDTPMGIYRTTDGGESWTQVLRAGGGFQSVEMCPSDPNIVYAGSGNEVYRSEDAGVTWTQVAGQGGNGWGPPGVLAGPPIDMQCDPDDTDRIFSNNYVGGNFLSEDGGVTWINASDGYSGAQITSVAVDPENPAQLYAGGRSGIWSSGDSGSTWQGMRYPPPGTHVWAGEWTGVAVDPTDSRHLLASEETIWESFDGGVSWQIRQTPAPAMSAVIMFAPSDASTVYTGLAEPICLLNAESPCGPGAGVYVSHDGGTTWDFANNANISDLMLLDLAVDPTDARVVYIGTMSGMFTTKDGGVSWTAMDGLPADTRVGSVAVNPEDPQGLMAGVEGQGLYLSADGGETWTQIAAGLQPNSSIRGILFDPTDDQIVYLSDLMSGVYRSSDGGQSWTQINNELTMRSTTGLGISSDGQHLYAATSGGGVFRMDLNGQPPVSTGIAGTDEQPTAVKENMEEPQTIVVESEATSEAPSFIMGVGLGIALTTLVVLVAVMIRRRKAVKG